METEIRPIDDADRARIQAALDRYTAAIARAPDPKYWSPEQDVPYVFNGSVEDINVLYRVQYDGPGGSDWWSLECDALIWANAVVRNTSFEWGKTASGELCIWREDYPRLLILPHARFFEAHHSSLCNAVSGMTASLVLNRLIFDCLLLRDDDEDVRALHAAIEPGDYEAILAAVRAFPVW